MHLFWKEIFPSQKRSKWHQIAERRKFVYSHTLFGSTVKISKYLECISIFLKKGDIDLSFLSFEGHVNAYS